MLVKCKVCFYDDNDFKYADFCLRERERMRDLAK